MTTPPEPGHDEVVVERTGVVTVIAINRPAARNAVDGPTATALAEAFEAFDRDDETSVAVLTGHGGTFCAGADLKALGTDRQNSARPIGRGPMGPTRMVLSKPVIAAVEGYAVAGGLELALWCDLRVAASDAVFGVFCRRWGVPLIDGGTVRLPRLVGQSHALDLILTGRPVSGEEARTMGLANRLVPPGTALTAAIELANQLAAFPQLCLRADRHSAISQWGDHESAAMVREFDGGFSVIRSGETLAGAQRFARGEGRHGAPGNATP
jgi:enoyl-CoA hydratase